MPKNTKTVVAAFLFCFVLAACGDRSPAQPAPSTGAGTYEQALAHAQCMRANGVPDFPDPQRQGGAVNSQIDQEKDGPDLTTALEACRDKMPQGEGEGPDGGSVDAVKLAGWTECMRGKLPKFPDPQVSGNSIAVELKGTGIKGDSADFENARKACESEFPGGSLRVVDQP